MLCDICKKNNAVIHIQEMHNGETNVLNICSKCATEHNIDEKGLDALNLPEILLQISEKIDSKFLTNLLKQDKEQSIESLPMMVCNQCSWDTSKFLKHKRLGCQHCYSVFAPFLQDLIKGVHKGNIHIGKAPSNNTIQENKRVLKITNLQSKLDICIKNEEYEEAARLRDEILELKGVN